MRGIKCKDEDDLKNSKPKEFYASGIYNLLRRWREIVCTKGEYTVKLSILSVTRDVTIVTDTVKVTVTVIIVNKFNLKR